RSDCVARCQRVAGFSAGAGAGDPRRAYGQAGRLRGRRPRHPGARAPRRCGHGRCGVLAVSGERAGPDGRRRRRWNHAAEVDVVRGTNVTASMLEAGSLSLVVRAGAGYNTIDVPTASKRGIYVSNCPGKNAIAVAELACGLMLALDRRIPDNVAELRAGKWNKKEYSKARGLYGRTLGLLGYGNIGQE